MGGVTFERGLISLLLIDCGQPFLLYYKKNVKMGRCSAKVGKRELEREGGRDTERGDEKERIMILLILLDGASFVFDYAPPAGHILPVSVLTHLSLKT